MQPIALFQVDAFTDKLFHGNPAAVCLLNEWFNDELLQAIAIENNLSETAFVLEEEQGFHIRWFTPNGEVSLCGHATLAAGFVLFELGRVTQDVLQFSSLSGPLSVKRDGAFYTLDFPSLSFHELKNANEISALLDYPVFEAFESPLDYLVLLGSCDAVAKVKVNLPALADLPKRGLIVTARALDADFYSRCFYPKYHVPEDPVTGSAHCVLTPFWSSRLGKKKLKGIQGATRKGEVLCQSEGDRVYLSGQCRWYLKGYIQL
jgi:PhzF family phenazine biosynthesis protein